MRSLACGGVGYKFIYTAVVIIQSKNKNEDCKNIRENSIYQ